MIIVNVIHALDFHGILNATVLETKAGAYWLRNRSGCGLALRTTSLDLESEFCPSATKKSLPPVGLSFTWSTCSAFRDFLVSCESSGRSDDLVYATSVAFCNALVVCWYCCSDKVFDESEESPSAIGIMHLSLVFIWLGNFFCWNHMILMYNNEKEADAMPARLI